MRHGSGEARRTTSTAVALAALVMAVTPSGQLRTECGTPPPAMRDVTANTFYSDARHSIVDPVRYERRRQSIAPLQAFETELARYASRSQNGSAAWGALCGTLARRLGAGRGAARSHVGDAGRVRAQMGAGVAGHGLCPRQAAHRRVGSGADRTLARPRRRRRRRLLRYPSSRNCATTTTTGSASPSWPPPTATGDEKLVGRAEAIFDETVRQIAVDGHLPLRGGARTAGAALSQFRPAAAGDDGRNRGAARRRLVRQGGRGVASPGPLYARCPPRSGDRWRVSPTPIQEPLEDKSFGWMALYGARFPARVNGEADLATRRYWVTWAGGDMNALAKAWVK